VRAIVGPWDHSLYDPGPAVETRYEMVRWWDYWLKGRNTGIMDEPRLTAYMRRSHEPDPWIRGQDIPGDWRADSWPPKGLAERAWYFHADHGLREAPPLTTTAPHGAIRSAHAQA
jgi:predicted acyl esterase